MKFLFIVQGEGRGHLTQAITLEEILRRNGHEVVEVLVGKSSSRRLPGFFNRNIHAPIKRFVSPNFLPTPANKRVSLMRSVAYNLVKLPVYINSINYIRQRIEASGADRVINFYELLTGLTYFLFRPSVPQICIGHQYLFLHKSFEFPKADKVSLALLKFFTVLTSLGAKERLALSFRYMKDDPQNNIRVIPPLLRKEVTLHEPYSGDYIHGYMVNAGFSENVMKWHRQHPRIPLRFFWDKWGNDFTVMPWDWSYYSHKLKDQKFQIDDEMLRPYFELSKVKEGVFGLATRLYGITFKKNSDIPVYHKDVDAYEVFDKDGKFLSVLYTDFHPREGKRAGAWMTSYKEQWIDEATGENSRPHISIVMNFTKPTKDKPALLTFGELETFLHEFGHSLHGMFANSTYENLSGTNVYWDFVELPSQFMENFAIEKEFLHTFARHYQTGELIPDELVQRIVDSSNFDAAYACLRQVSFGLLDMAWYTRTTPFDGDVKAYEKEAWKKAQILPVVEDACMSTQFSHIFAGGYSAGYYSYKWAEVLDADAFSLFKQKGIFNPEVTASFRENSFQRRNRTSDDTIQTLSRTRANY